MSLKLSPIPPPFFLPPGVTFPKASPNLILRSSFSSFKLGTSAAILSLAFNFTS
jgi:hypothetical protein